MGRGLGGEGTGSGGEDNGKGRGGGGHYGNGKESWGVVRKEHRRVWQEKLWTVLVGGVIKDRCVCVGNYDKGQMSPHPGAS